MPLHDFLCRSCGSRFEARVPHDERPNCPECGVPAAERLVSPFAGPFTVGLRGPAARRSNAVRRSREEQRREQREQRRSQRKQQS
jgi:putative FmdB family regulatory protein